MPRPPSSLLVLGALLAAPAAFAAGCGNLDQVTTVKDLRVLAVMAEPAGFLIDLDNPGVAPAADLTATLTALVVDPQGDSQTLSFTAEGCPDYIDTITAATGKTSKLCPAPEVTSQIPAPVGPALATTPIVPPMPGTAGPEATAPIEYHPSLSFGLSPEQVGLFFAPTPTGIAAIDQSVAYNRDFGLDAIVTMTFSLGTESITVIKRLVYWPRLSATQQPNQNPKLALVQLYAHRNADSGDPEDMWPDGAPPTLSLAAKDQLYVQPARTAGDAESYLLRVKNTETMQVETRTVASELLTYQFYATAGTFSPAERTSELDPFRSPTGGAVHIDSRYNLPAVADLPADGKVTLWVVVRDERAGTSWASRTINLVP